MELIHQNQEMEVANVMNDSNLDIFDIILLSRSYIVKSIKYLI